MPACVKGQCGPEAATKEFLVEASDISLNYRQVQELAYIGCHLQMHSQLSCLPAVSQERGVEAAARTGAVCSFDWKYCFSLEVAM